MAAPTDMIKTDSLIPTVQHKKEFFSLDAPHSGLCGQITVNW